MEFDFLASGSVVEEVERVDGKEGRGGLGLVLVDDGQTVDGARDFRTG